MRRSDLNILIVEDDPSVGKATESLLQRHGYKTRLLAQADEAMSQAKVNEFHGVIIDCMIPGVDGVELAAQMREEFGDDLLIVLMSGIFKDKQYAKEACRKTGAKAFLTKPFDHDEMLEIVDEHFADDLDEDREPLFQVLNQKTLSDPLRVKTLQETEYIHGFDLPLVYSLLINSKISGRLTLTNTDGESFEVSFYKGAITNVVLQDDESFFGVLLVEKGFTSYEEVQEGLAQESSKPIGERLVDISSLSPHAIKIIQLEQCIIRLSKTICDDSLRLEFVEKEMPYSDVSLTALHFVPLLNDWISSKIESDWLKAFYLPWLEYPFLNGENIEKLDLFSTLPLLTQTPKILANFADKPLQELLEISDADEDDILRSLHFLLISRVVILSDRKVGSQDFKKKLARLEKIFGDIDSQSHYEVLGLSNRARSSEISRAYHDLAKALHPDKVPRQAPKELKDLTNKIFSRINDAYRVLADEKKRKAYIKELEFGQVEEALNTESRFESARRMLSKGQYKEAYYAFKEILEVKGARKDTVIYLTWALLKYKGYRADPEKLQKRIKKLFSQIPHEERHNPTYFFTRGLYYQIMGNYPKAYKYLKHATALEPSFIEAKRELVSVKKKMLEARRKQSLLDGELSTVVTKFFSGGKKR